VRWLGTPVGVPAGGATLAELLAVRDGTSVVTTPEQTAPDGLYL